MSAPLFSVVIPTYNRSELVVLAVESVLRQTLEDLEVVVSDNCSTDRTREAVEAIRDPRVRYVRTPRHSAIADSWDFARAQARGRLMMTLSDDDALVETALERFAEAHRELDADFLFSNVAEYRDPGFPGEGANTVKWRPFSGITRAVPRDEFLEPMYAFRPRFVTHPSAYVVARDVVDRIAGRCGHFFRSNGVEFFAWPLAAAFSKRIAHIDAPLVFVGRTAKSWGSNLVLANPGADTIRKMISDNDHDRAWVPLTNFTLCNLMAEGLLLAKEWFPEELRRYEFGEGEYLKRTAKELVKRERMGVDVVREIDELLVYASKYPPLRRELNRLVERSRRPRSEWRRLAGRLRPERARRRLAAALGWSAARTAKKPPASIVSGSTAGFENVLECADYLGPALGLTPLRRHPAADAQRLAVLEPST